ncbi:L-lactate dehydrogenase (FMN-dependent)-like alpha-hydroxy acid dehydrogenase [Streptococcus pneumoniae]|nr:hypothetical protein [Streptococcus pneumoniae]MDG7305493.1 hypothetical protein [Streptococcus pneumoniae]MDG7341131.1 hypothetical protein [Streptococcus pneumoniae]MDG7349017.1 hypothetical protein [Streptococcus pneumoniae]MDG7380818.1 hypothetical protein [Streptococcus pneumoniae]MDG7658364.1 hypothetical protein [Streptococcus pneumoniae]
MSYKTSNAEGHVDFINTYDLEPMAQQVILKQHLAISLVGRKILSLLSSDFSVRFFLVFKDYP